MLRRFLIPTFIFACGILLFVPQTHAAYTYYREFTATSSATAIPSAQSNFPALVDVTLSSLKSAGNGGHVQNASGYDIGFGTENTCSSGKINYERENYVSSTGEFEAWVPIATLTTSTKIYMCYGDASVSTDPSSSTAPWDANYVAVYHLGSQNTFNDSTGNYNLTNHGAVATSSGAIDGSLAGNGSSQYASSTSGPSISNEVTYELWERVNSTSTEQPFLTEGTSTASVMYVNHQDAAHGSTLDFDYYYGGLDSPAAYTDTNWHQMVGVFDTANLNKMLFIDGVGVVTSSYIGSFSFPGPLIVGADPIVYGSYLNGAVDEIRISKVARSASWIASDYWTQYATGTAGFWSVGAEQGGSATRPSVKLRGGGAVAGSTSVFSHYRELTATSSATAIPSAQSNFPALVDVTLASLKSTSHGGYVQNAQGYDIAFGTENTCSSGKINYERENYVSSTGEFEAWVPIATLTTSTKIYMCYGDASVSTDPSSSTAPWDANFEGVYHFPNSTTLTSNDSTANTNNGTNYSMAATTGAVDGAASFNGTSGYVSLSTSTPSLSPFGNFTAEYWVNWTGNSTNQFHLYLASSSNNNEVLGIAYSDSTGLLHVEGYSGCISCGSRDLAVTIPMVSSGTWVNIAVTKQTEPGNVFGQITGVYVNGVNQTFTPDTATLAMGNVTGNTIGSDWQTGAYLWGLDGSMDELRFSGVQRSSSWIASDYWTQFATGTAGFWSVGSDQQSPSLGPAVKLRGGGTAAPTPDLFNDGFEAGNLNSWTVAGSSTVQSSIVAHGNYALKLTGTTDSVAKNLAFPIVNSSTFYYRAYIYRPTPSAEMNMTLIRYSSGDALLSYDAYPSGYSALFVRSGPSLNYPSYPFNKWVRVEVKYYFNSSSTGSEELRLYNGDSLVPFADLATSTFVSNVESYASLNQVYFAEGVSSQTVYVDDVAVSDTGWLGPVNRGPVVKFR
ncbi:MAG: laminin G domain-containing protein [Patescibacteria group bacterium]|nr:laminin G domain-containing protein [Patescibacteria group bacterium]